MIIINTLPMKQIFKLRKDEYYKTRQQLFSTFIGFIVFFIVIMWGVFYFTNTKIPTHPHWYNSYLIFLFIFPIFLQFWGQVNRAKISNKRYQVTFDNHAITLTQLGIWNEFIVRLILFKPRYTNSIRRIPYKEITAIEKSRNGSFVIKGQQNSYPNTLIISPHIEQAKNLEITLSEIKTISKYPTPSDTSKEFKNLDKTSFSLIQNSYPILSMYLVGLFLSYFWIDPINWPLTIFISIVFLSASIALVWKFRKLKSDIYSLTVDTTRIIVEHRDGTLKVIPFNQITSTRKRSNNLLIVTNSVNSSFANFTVIPNTLDNFAHLEERLNTIHPIAY